jgi:hypothetical protein
MRYEFWKEALSDVAPLATRQRLLFLFPRGSKTKLRTGGILPKVYNVTLYSTWEAQ